MTGLGVDWEQRVDWDELRRSRTARVQNAMADAGLDAVLVQRFGNVRYLTSARMFPSVTYVSRYAALLTREGPCWFFCEPGDLAHTREFMPWIQEVRPWPYQQDTCVASIVEAISELDLEAGSIGLDDAVAHDLAAGLLSHFPELTLADAAETMSSAKQIKSKDEVSVIKAAAELAEVGMYAALSVAGAGRTEAEVAAEMTKAMIVAGADNLVAFPQVSTSPFRRMASDKRLRSGELLLIDVNVSFCGYVGDMARTTIIGSPSPEQVSLARAQLEALDAAKNVCNAGARTSDVQTAVARVIAAHGLENAWHDYLTGHGIGTDDIPFEWPLIGSEGGFDREITQGMVVALEPGLFLPGVGVVRNEDMVLVGPEGNDVLTTVPFDERLM